jgi:hypothetical protein
MNVFEYALRHITLQVPAADRTNRPRFVFGDRELVVEKIAAEYFRGEGWWVIKGDDAHLFFSFFSANFKNSFFYDVCAGYVGEQMSEFFQSLRKKTDAAIKSGIIENDHLEQAADFICHYYKSPSDHSRFRKLAKLLSSIGQQKLIGLLRMYSQIGYTTKGSPDLFMAKPGLLRFVEVKSPSDALRAEQYDFIERFLMLVSEDMLIFRVLPMGSNLPIDML